MQCTYITMKKFSWLLVAFLTFIPNIFGQSQQKNLSLEDAVLGYYKGLYPKNLRALQWVSDTDTYVYMENNSYHIKNTKNQLINQVSLSDFKGIYPEMKRLPRFESINKSEIVFQKENAYTIFDYKNPLTR